MTDKISKLRIRDRQADMSHDQDIVMDWRQKPELAIDFGKFKNQTVYVEFCQVTGKLLFVCAYGTFAVDAQGHVEQLGEPK